MTTPKMKPSESFGQVENTTESADQVDMSYPTPVITGYVTIRTFSTEVPTVDLSTVSTKHGTYFIKF